MRTVIQTLLALAWLVVLSRKWRNEARAAVVEQRSLWEEAQAEHEAAIEERERALEVLRRAQAIHQEHAHDEVSDGE